MLLNNGSSALRGLSRRSSNHVTDENAMSSTANRMKGASTPGRNPSKKGLSVSNENEVSFSVPSGKGLSSNLQGNKTPATARRRAFGDISNRKTGRNEGSTNNGNGGRGLGDSSVLKQSKSKFVTFQTAHQSNNEAQGGVNHVRAPGSSHRTPFSNMSAKKSASKNIMTQKESLRTKEFILPQRATFLEPTPQTVKSRNKGVSNSSRNTTETQQLESVESIEDVEYPAGRLGCEQTEDDSVDLSIELNRYAIDLEGHKRDLEMINLQICIEAFEYADRAMNAEMDKLALDDMTLK
eukprot:scaffold696346_cov51-Attheya_sp.AAC.4